ncbi:MAG: hypothetical protein J6V52_00050 [Bacteroidaceae bacterium]|nr:hypothetical protein [Bacteroidaceae bacterium]
MIKIENTEVFGWEAAIRGMRNPMNSWEKSDSGMAWCGEIEARNRIGEPDLDGYVSFVGPNDLKLMQQLSKAGSDHGKFLRMINVTMDVTAPLYWWKEASTYRVGVTMNSCSTMHKIHAKEFTLDDFSHEHLTSFMLNSLKGTIDHLNLARSNYLEIKNKDDWWQMIQLLPSSYNQRRTVQLNYQVLKNMYFARKNHKLDEWRDFCKWVEELPYFKEICIEPMEEKT